MILTCINKLRVNYLNIITILLVITLTGCSYLPRPSFLKIRDSAYLRARSAPPLRIPPGISSGAFSTYYPVPYRAYPQEAKAVSLVPPGLYTK